MSTSYVLSLALCCLQQSYSSQSPLSWGTACAPHLPTVCTALRSLPQGDQFNLLGDVASLLIPILAVAAVGVGIFASQTYYE